MGRRGGYFDDLHSGLRGPTRDEGWGEAGLVPVRLRSRKRHRGGGDRSRVGGFGLGVCRGRNDGEDDAADWGGSGCLLILLFILKFFRDVLQFPAGTADRTTDPFGCSGGMVLEGNIVPQDEGVVALDTDAGVGADLSFEDARSGAGALSKRTSALLEEIEGIKRWVVGSASRRG